MLDADEKRLGLLFEVARMHYGEGLSKTKIANRLDTSATQVGRFLKEAQRLKMVRFWFEPPKLPTLQAALLKRFDCLKDARVIPSAVEYQSHLENLGKAGAMYFDEVVKDGMCVGICGGNTIDAVINALPMRERKLKLFPTILIGRGPQIPEHVDSMVLLHNLWEQNKRGGPGGQQPHYTTILPFEKKRTGAATLKALRDDHVEVLKRPKVKAVLDGMKKVDLVLASIGDKDTSSVLTLLSELDIGQNWIEKEKIVGDMSYSLFDENGQTKERWKFFLTLSVDDFRQMAADPTKQVVLIAGMRKERPLKAALKGRLCNMLITDQKTAETLLEN